MDVAAEDRPQPPPEMFVAFLPDLQIDVVLEECAMCFALIPHPQGTAHNCPDRIAPDDPEELQMHRYVISTMVDLRPYTAPGSSGGVITSGTEAATTDANRNTG